MAFTKIVGAGIHTLSNVHTHNINSSGIITATSFVGPLDGTNGDFSGNVTIDGNLIVNGDTTTLNTTLREVEILRVDANSSAIAGIITQRGSGDIFSVYDTSTEVFKIADGGQATFTGNVGIADSIFHINDIDTLIGFSANGTVRITANNERVAEFSGTYGGGGSVTFYKQVNAHGGTVNIAPTIASSTLPVLTVRNNSQSYHTVLNLQNTNATSSVIQWNNYNNTSTAGNLILRSFNSPNTEYLRITGDGKVGIGTDNPVAKLQLEHSGLNAELFRTWTTTGSARREYFLKGPDSGNGNNPYRWCTGNSHSWEVDNIERMRINYLGNVGIGTDNPNKKLHVHASSGTPVLISGDIPAVILNPSAANSSDNDRSTFGQATGNNNFVNGASAGDTVLRGTNSGKLLFGLGTSEKMRIDSSGNAILKTANAAFKSESSSSGDYVRLYAGSGTGKWDIYGDSQYLRITDNDSVGSIRTDCRLGVGSVASHANLSSRITATGAIPTTGLIQTNNDNHALQLWNQSNSATYCGLMLETRTSGASGWLIANEWKSTYAGDLVFRGRNGGTSSSERLRLTSDGKVGINENSPTRVLSINGDMNLSSGSKIESYSSGGNLQIQGGSTYPGGHIKMYGGSGDDMITFNTSGSNTSSVERLRIDSGGSVSIGDAATHTYSAHSEGDDLVIGGSGWRGMTIYGENGGGVIQFADDGNNRIGQILYNHGNDSMDFRVNGNVTRLQLDSDGSSYNTSNSSGTTTHQFYNSNSGSGADTRVMVKTYANQGADPYIKFDSGGSNHVVGQSYGGTTNNKLVLGVGESPSSGVSGIHIAGDGVTQVTNHISMTKSSDPRIYSGTSVGLNIDGQALYLNRYVNSTIAMGRGGGAVEVSNTNSGNDAQLNVYKATGSNNDYARLRVGYDASNCLAISRKRNSSSISIDANQSDAIVHHSADGDDTMLLTNRNSVHIAKLAPMVIKRPHIQSNSTWGGARPVTFTMRFSTGNFSATYHVARMITQHDWGFADWTARVYRDYYSPNSNSHSVHRYTGYYASHTDHVLRYNQRGGNENAGYDGESLSKNNNLGVNGAHKIHTAANGGYYKDAYATDYYVSLGNYSGVTIDITVYNPGGYLKDTSTTLTDTYPASFGGQVADQDTADNWNGATSGGGRGLWFNVRQGVLDWWGYSSNFGQQNLPIS